MPNPLVDDRTVDFLLYEMLDAEALCRLPGLSEHSRETFDLYLDAARRLARDVLFPTYRALDEAPPALVDGRVHVHPVLRELYPKMIELGVTNATRPETVGGQSLPVTVASMANAYLMAANLSAYGYIGLTTSAARLIESFGTSALKDEYMRRMYSGEWTGTMALTEPQAGSSLSDVKTRATPTPEGHYLIQGSKIFISGADQDFTENVVHMTLARIDGAPPGIKGISLFVVPNRRLEGGELVPNDTICAGLIHKIGWKGLPSVALNYGEAGDCHGWLLGEPNRGISYMFQMMNEARLMVGLNGAATASVAFHEALEYAKTRPQGRPPERKSPELPQVPIIEHADVRRMLLRQKAIVEGALSLLGTCARLTDLSEHASSTEERERSFQLLDLLTPVAKSFPAEKGFEANVLSVQIHGGYGYSSEYLPEAFLRDQKLNSLHEGTTGIQSLDLLGRKVHQAGGAGFRALLDEVTATIHQARDVRVPEDWCEELEAATTVVQDTTEQLGEMGAKGDTQRMLLHSVDYLDLFGTWVVAWLWLKQATIAKRALDGGSGEHHFYRGKLSAAQYWLHTELPRTEHLAELCRTAESSYATIEPSWL
jgi:butyryl-CoA dehydrogenase